MAAPLAPGAEIAGYRIVRTLGHGGMGVVYLAEDRERGGQLAIKLLAAELAEQGDFRRRFLREARYASQLDHPNIVRVQGAGEADGNLYIAMQYIPGSDLTTVLAERGRLDPPRALSMLEQVAAGLDAVHAAGMLHRDVKPGNVLVADPGHDANGSCYLTDFGLTKSPTQDSAALTSFDTFVGTLDYVAPEQILKAEVDHRVDVYSLACLLYECLSGLPPFRHLSGADLLQAHIREVPPPMPRPELAPAIHEVVARGLAKKPEDRFGSCGELMAAARAALRVPAAERLPPRARPRVGSIRLDLRVGPGEARLGLGGSSGTVRLVRDGGRWRIGS